MGVVIFYNIDLGTSPKVSAGVSGESNSKLRKEFKFRPRNPKLRSGCEKVKVSSGWTDAKNNHSRYSRGKSTTGKPLLTHYIHTKRHTHKTFKTSIT
jgi:hypothetical protein